MRSDLAKVVLVVAVAVAVLIVFGVVRDRGETATAPPSAGPTAAQSVTPAPTTAEPSASLTGAPSADASESAEAPSWAPVVIGFARAFTDTKATRSAWLAQLAPYADERVKKSLESYDRSQIPAQSFDSYEQLDSDTGQLAVQVNYADGWLLVLYLTNHDDQWLVSAYDQLEQ